MAVAGICNLYVVVALGKGSRDEIGGIILVNRTEVGDFYHQTVGRENLLKLGDLFQNLDF